MAAAAAAAARLSPSESSSSFTSLSFARSYRRSLSHFLGRRLYPCLSIRPLQGHRKSLFASWIAPVNEVAVDGSAKAAAVAAPKLEEDVFEEPPASAKEATISAFMADVANLIKLVDSRDIVELELKNGDCEIVIRKKDALPQPPPPPFSSPIVAQLPYPAYPPPAPTPAPPPAAVPTSAISPAPISTSAASPASALPAMLSPMAGTFYRSPGPGELPFVKVGDKVQKGQVICIVEAMKLMNEIEADQTGTIVDIVAEDAKPVSVDSPLFVIKP